MNPYDKYSSDNQVPRLTDEVIQKKIKETVRISMSSAVMITGPALLLAGLFTKMASDPLSNLLGDRPVLIGLIIAAIWLTTVGFLVYFYRDYVQTRIAYSGKYHIVKRELHTISRDEYQGMRWHYRKGHLYRSPEFRDVFYFDGMEKLIVGRKIADRATEGDEYLIVVFDRAPTVPQFIFRTDAYRWP